MTKILKNPDLLRQVARMIREERAAEERMEKHKLNFPQFSMNNWGTTIGDYPKEDKNIPFCKTSACVAGFVVWLKFREYYQAALNNEIGLPSKDERASTDAFSFMAREELFSDELDHYTEIRLAEELFSPDVSFWSINNSPWTPVLLEWMADNDTIGWAKAAAAIMPAASLNFFLNRQVPYWEPEVVKKRLDDERKAVAKYEKRRAK